MQQHGDRKCFMQKHQRSTQNELIRLKVVVVVVVVVVLARLEHTGVCPPNPVPVQGPKNYQHSQRHHEGEPAHDDEPCKGAPPCAYAES